MIVLGIETSCDETSAAVVDATRTIRAHIVATQLEEHQRYGGVVPEIGARAHLEKLPQIVSETLRQANLGLEDIDGIAATAGPGLIGGLIVGVVFAKSLALVHKKPFLAVNHLAAHGLTPRLSDNVEFPYLLLLVSGGHCQLIVVKSPLHFQVLGSTMDDAAGECFDKTARLLNLPYPGAPRLEAVARQGDAERFRFPRPLLHHPDPNLKCSFSFSGLKTAVRQSVSQIDQLSAQDISDVAASFQAAVADILASRTSNALAVCKELQQPLTAVVVAGGVAANQYLRGRLQAVSEAHGLPFVAPPLNLCTDNGAMIAWAGLEKLRLGADDPLDFRATPRWPLQDLQLPGTVRN
ncbi:MAG: tRNA (adenosine(37)-N6)-threonylcarbamoyltransferase complex transferase subunit TsaD [Holosporales bacterium]